MRRGRGRLEPATVWAPNELPESAPMQSLSPKDQAVSSQPVADSITSLASCLAALRSAAVSQVPS